MSPPILDYPQRTDHFILTTDASDVGLGAVLSTSRQTVIEFASRALTSAEKNYTTSEKECLAIIWATRKFPHYLVGTTFTVETDHKPLEWLESHKQSHARSQCLERWSLELRAYDFRIMYRPGKDNLCADSLSRMPVSLVAWEKPITNCLSSGQGSCFVSCSFPTKRQSKGNTNITQLAEVSPASLQTAMDTA